MRAPGLLNNFAGLLQTLLLLLQSLFVPEGFCILDCFVKSLLLLQFLCFLGAMLLKLAFVLYLVDKVKPLFLDLLNPRDSFVHLLDQFDRPDVRRAALLLERLDRVFARLQISALVNEAVGELLARLGDTHQRFIDLVARRDLEHRRLLHYLKLKAKQFLDLRSQIADPLVDRVDLLQRLSGRQKSISVESVGRLGYLHLLKHCYHFLVGHGARIALVSFDELLRLVDDHRDVPQLLQLPLYLFNLVQRRVFLQLLRLLSELRRPLGQLGLLLAAVEDNCNRFDLGGHDLEVREDFVEHLDVLAEVFHA